MLRLTIVSILLCTMSISANADRLWVGGWSHHFNSKDTTNSVHRAVMYEKEFSPFSLMVGYFENSYGRDVAMVSLNTRIPVGDWELVYGGGVNKGYRECYGDDGVKGRLCPHFFVGASYTRFKINPSVKLFGDAVIFIPEIRW